MARASAAKSSGPSRVRFIMVDAELADGDLTQITHAIQNALRPNNVVPSTPRAIAQHPAPANDFSEERASPEEVEDIPSAETPALQPRAAGARKNRTPKVLNLDLASGTSFVSFAQAKSPATDRMKFLVVAAWFMQHRDMNAITVDHVYTCYRAANWSTAISDFSAPLRSLKSSQLLEQTGKGAYSINHLGLDKVDKLGG
jgi:hypothetical protein